ncbi:hypothetical protein ACLIYP_14510 [Streptomyces nanhaiensis]|uniref:hypothetical protein n=1 Tax=Streptomyces nanhaiensis TaxID=679319 RepID=UPI00399D3805
MKKALSLVEGKHEVYARRFRDAAGARRYTDPALIAETSAGFDALYDRGEEFTEFFEREIAPLPPPAVGHRTPVGPGVSRP